MIRKELKIEPDAFDKEFLAWLEADTKKQVQNFDEWKSKMRRALGGGVEERLTIP